MTTTTPPGQPPVDKLSIQQAQDALAVLHAQHVDSGACPARGAPGWHGWAACDLMTLARLRGVGHTVYVVQNPTDYTIRVIDWWAEGPVGGLGADLYASVPYDRWGDAVLAALRLVLADAEFAETVTAPTALGIAARALAEADAAAAAELAGRYTP